MLVGTFSSFIEMKQRFQENPQMAMKAEGIHVIEEEFTNLDYILYAPSSVTFSNKGYYRLAHNQKWLTVHFEEMSNEITGIEYGMTGQQWKEHSWSKSV